MGIPRGRKRGSPYRIFRRRRNKLLLVVDEVCMKTGWKRMKAGYKTVGGFVYSQAAARAEKSAHDWIWKASR